MNRTPRNIIFLEMFVPGNTNGVTRCIQVIANALAKDKAYNISWIRFLCGGNCQEFEASKKDYTVKIIPLPTDVNSFLSNSQIRQKFWEETISEIVHVAGEVPILHIHTLNLIEFAIIVKQRILCKIVTHLHCIPWKSLFNKDVNKFNKYYQNYYLNAKHKSAINFVYNPYEWNCYCKSDCVICVTECARDYIIKNCEKHIDNIQVVPNGMMDIAGHEFNKCYALSNPVKCLFVGNSHDSKGLKYILESLSLLVTNYEISLYVAGKVGNKLSDTIQDTYPLLDIHFLGNIPFYQLCDYYMDSDIGIIASVQEQCSYVAIEMMMFGLPIITTDVDGLHEMFTSKENSIMIPLVFDATQGLKPDVKMMATALETLMTNHRLRKHIGLAARHQFNIRYSQRQMINSIKYIYSSLINCDYE